MEADGLLVFTIESRARSGDRLSNLLYAHLRMAKEIQLHMWTSVLERAVDRSGGRRFGRLGIETRWLEEGGPGEATLGAGTRTRVVRRGGGLAGAQFGLDLAAVDRGARPRRFRRVHRIQGALRCRHVVGRLEELDNDRCALVRVVEDLDTLRRDIYGRALAGLNVVQASGQVIRIDVREPDHACVTDP